MNIFLLRHGETDWNREGRIQGQTDVPLNLNGRMQIDHAAEILAGLYPGIDLILTSPLSRARESAEIVADRLAYGRENILVEPLLTERCFGAGEGLTEVERKERYPADIFPEMESLEELIHRGQSVFEKIVTSFSDKHNILMAAHGAILYAIVTAITGIPYGARIIHFQSASIHRIRYEKGTAELARYSDETSKFEKISVH